MNILKLLLAVAPIALTISTPALAQSADEGTPSLRYMLKAPILFTPGGTTGGGDTGGGDTGGGDTGGGDTGGNTESLYMSLPAGFLDWATVGDGFPAIEIGGGTPPYALGNPDSLIPPGLHLSGLGLSGNYAQAGAYDFLLRATDSDNVGDPADRRVTVTVEDGLSIPNYDQSVYQATVGIPFSLAAPVAEGGKPPYAYQPLTNGIAVDPATGALSWTPTTAGTTPPFRLDVKDARLRPAHTNDIQVNVSSPLTAAYPQASYTLRSGVVGSIPAPVVVGGRIPVGTLGGTAPAGMTHAANGSVTGTPTTADSGSVSYSVTDADGRTALASTNWTVNPALAVTGVSSNYSGTVQLPFSGVSPSATGLVPPATWTMSGTLPAGLSFNSSNGAIAGTFASNAASSSGLTLTVTDSLGTATSNAFAINVSQDISATISADTINVVLPGSYFSTTDWESGIDKRLVIPAGVTVYSNSTGLPALTTGTGYGGTLTIEVRGNVYGAGGATSSAAGGTAMVASTTTVVIDNYGNIKGGGGAGGQGGTGGAAGGWNTSGGITSQLNTGTPTYYCQRGSSGTPVTAMIWNGASLGSLSGVYKDVTTGSSAVAPYRYTCASAAYYAQISRQLLVFTQSAAGGTGGAGGRGQGYLSAAQTGATGTSGGTGAGAGGQGGTGGAFGSGGSTGSTGSGSATQGGSTGTAGGASGAAISGNPVYHNMGGAKLP